MPHIGFNERMVQVVNPCPKTTVAELHERAEIFSSNAGDVEDFLFEYVYSTGTEAEHMFLRPGESRSIQASLATDLRTHLEHRGLVLVQENESLELKCLDGLRRAQQFWHENGRMRLAAYMGRHGFRAEDIGTVKYKVPNYFLNQAREDAIVEEIERRENELRERLRVGSAAPDGPVAKALRGSKPKPERMPPPVPETPAPTEPAAPAA